MGKDGTTLARILRHRAEQRLHDRIKTAPSPVTTAELQRLCHELQVHQIELEMQNEELQRMKTWTDSSLERFTALFDFAPVGYITLDHKGTIHAVNFAGAALLRDVRSQLVGRPFRYFLANDPSSAGVKVVVASAEIMQHQEVSFPPLIQGSDKPSPRASNSWYFWTSDSGS